MEKELKGRMGIKQRFKNNWRSEFYLAAINPYDSDTLGVGKKFELSFESIIEDDTDYIGLIWDNGYLSEIEAK